MVKVSRTRYRGRKAMKVNHMHVFGERKGVPINKEVSSERCPLYSSQKTNSPTGGGGLHRPNTS